MNENTHGAKIVISFTMLAAVVAFALALFAPGMAQQAYAADEMFDSSQTGSITVSPVSSDGGSVSGTFELYLVATPVADDTGWHFQWTDAYKGTDTELYNKTGDLDDSYKKQLATTLQDKVTSPLATAQVQSGTASFNNLQPGLYLVKMTDVQSGYDAVEPFLVSVPTQSGNALVYNVDASPKAGTVSVTPTTPEEQGQVATPANDTKLPQTGQLWWPVFVLAGAGAVLVLAGVLRKRMSGKQAAVQA